MTDATTPPPTATTSTSTSHTPASIAKSNYAAPNTPIASAKRPRNQKSAAKTPHTASKTIHEHSQSNHGIDEDSTHSSTVMTPIRKYKVTSPNSASNEPSMIHNLHQPMSPMHPVKPVTKREEEEQIETEKVGKWSKMFSPVLKLLHKNDEKEEEQPYTYEEPSPVKTPQSSQGEICKSSSTDTDGDVKMYGGMASPAPVVTAHESDSTYSPTTTDDYAATTSTAGSAYGQYYSTSTDQQAVSTPTHTTTTTTTSDQYNQQQQQYSPAESEQSEEEEEDEFNPYLFIKYLPAYERVVPYPHHKICLPSKDPNDPPISLVLDLDETLVHCTVEPIDDADMTFPVLFNGIEYTVHVRTRPYLVEFLEAVYDKFEVVVFTASQEVYANELLNRIDPGEFDKRSVSNGANERQRSELCLIE